MDGVVISDVSKRYFDRRGNPFMALERVSFEWERGENLAIIGESGSGKSTLARLIIGLESPTKGKYILMAVIVHSGILSVGGRNAAGFRQ